MPILSEKKIVNLSKFDCVLIADDGSNLFFPMEGKVSPVFLREESGAMPYKGKNIKITKPRVSEIIGLPPQREDTVLIVTALVSSLCPERDDLFIVDEPVKESVSGKIVAFRSLCKPIKTL